MTLTYADGRIAVIKNSRRAVYGYDQRLELLGSEGLLQAQNMLENTVVKSTTAGVTGAKPTYFFLERYMPAYAAEWAAFVDALAVPPALDNPVLLPDPLSPHLAAERAGQDADQGDPDLHGRGKFLAAALLHEVRRGGRIAQVAAGLAPNRRFNGGFRLQPSRG